MPRPTRSTLLALVLATTAAIGLSATGATYAQGSNPSVTVHGTLLVVDSERPGGARSYAVAVDGRQIVRISGRFGAAARTGATFEGRLVLPAHDADPTSALRTASRSGQVLPVAGTPSITAAAPTVTPTTHQQYVAAMDNKGALGQDDTQLLGHVSTVGSYWTHQANGAIAAVSVPATVTHYDTTLTTTDCGLGGDFFSIVQEAEGLFPGFTFSGGDQLVVFVPPACASGSIVGEASLGSSFATGGALVVKAGSAIEGTYAHETGHNYGFAHANAQNAGTSMEYYGVYDVMGFALGGYNQLTALSTPFRVFQGITDPGEIGHVDLGNLHRPVHASTTIRPRSDDSGQRSVEVTDPDTGKSLYLDYRAGTGEDAGAFYADTGGQLGSAIGNLRYAPGVLITEARGGSGTDVLVLDDQHDTSLGSGDSWTNATGDLTVRVTDLTTSGAQIHVDYVPALRTLTSAKPVIHRKPRVGRTLVARHGHWSPGTRFTYRWYAGRHVIAHQSTRRLLVTKAMRGSHIRVKVTGTNPGYTTVSRTSARTAKVR